MIEQADIVIVGAGTAGAFFGWLMAKKGYVVVILEKEPKEKVGNRLDIFHFDSIKFEEFGIPPPKKGAPELIAVHKIGHAHSPNGKYSKPVKYGFHVMRLKPFLNRLHQLARNEGAEFMYCCNFVELNQVNNRIIGVVAKQEGKKVKINSRLLVDASGIEAVVRTSIPSNYGVETFKLAPDDVLYVVLRYISWSKPQETHPKDLNLWPLNKVFCNPSYTKKEAILGVGQPHSFDNAEKALNEFLSNSRFPSFEIQKIERGITPYRRPPYSLVGDGFVCIGDAACITKPFSGEGISATWTLCKIASEVVDLALQKKEYLTQQSLWEVNVNYFRGQGAKFAELLAQIPGASEVSSKEMDYLFNKKIIFNEKDLSSVQEKFEVDISFIKSLKIVFNMIQGILTKKFSQKNVKKLLKALSIAKKIRKHYESFPLKVEDFESWVQKAEELWHDVS